MTTDLSTEVSQEEFVAPSMPVAFEDTNLIALFKKVEAEVKAELPDVNTPEGRKRIKALAADVSASKKALDTPMRDYLRAIKAFPKTIEKNARESVERFDALRDELLAPLQAASAPQDAIISMLEGVSTACVQESLTAQQAKDLMASVEAVDIESLWPEYQKKAKGLKEAALIVAGDTARRLELSEKQAAELEALRKEQAEAAQRERDRIIREEADRKAREEEQRRNEQRILDERNKAEADRLARIKAEQDAAEAESLRKLEAEQSRQREEQQRLQAIEDQKQAEARAAEAERSRLAEEQRRKQEEEDRRAADKEHRSKINRAVLAAVISNSDFAAAVATGDADAIAKAVITLAAKGQAGNMVVKY